MQCKEIEVKLSGYLDGELTQQDRQRVRLHVEECASCRLVLDELQDASNETRQLNLSLPSEKEWEHVESSILQNVGRKLGWIIIAAWAAMTSVYALFQYATAPGEPLFEKLMVFGLILGFSLVFLSILAERVRESRTDRYRGVHK